MNYTSFDPLTMPHNFSMAIYGRRRSGKTIVLKDILSKIKKWFDSAYLFSETIDDQPLLYNFIPKENRFNSFDQEKIRKIYTKQQGYIRQEMDKNPKVDKSKLKHILFIFDDCINAVDFRSSEILNKIHVSGRHTNCASIILSQEVGGKNGINKVQRTNEDIIISFFQKADYDRELIISQYLSIVDKKIGNEIYRSLTSKDFHCIVIENYKTTQKYEEFVHWYLADEKVKDFIIGELPGEEKPIKFYKIPTSSMKYNIVKNDETEVLKLY